MYTSIIIKSEHDLISLRYRGITYDIHFQNHKIAFTYMRKKSLPNCRRALLLTNIMGENIILVEIHKALSYLMYDKIMFTNIEIF